MKNLAIMAGLNADLMMTRDSGLLFLGHPVYANHEKELCSSIGYSHLKRLNESSFSCYSFD